ncbi:MAG: ArsR/SmtB family transcription factor [Desulfovibrionaceae bacterium]
MQAHAEIFKALAEPTRLRLLLLLSTGERCVCDLMHVLGRPQATVSRHLARLRTAGLVRFRTDNRWYYYRLNQDDPFRRELLHLALDRLTKADAGQADLAALEAWLAEKNAAKCA